MKSLLSGGSVQLKTTSSVLAKTTSTSNGFIGGRYTSVAAADLPVLTGFNLPKATFGIVLFLLDSAGTVTTSYVSDATSFSTVSGARGSTAALAVMPQDPSDKLVIGGILVGAKSDTAFTGNSTALDAAGYSFVFFDGLGQVQPVSDV